MDNFVTYTHRVITVEQRCGTWGGEDLPEDLSLMDWATKFASMRNHSPTSEVRLLA